MEENPPGLNAPTHQVDIQQQILETVLKEQAYQDLGERLRLVEEQLSNEKKEKDKALQEKSDLSASNGQILVVYSTADLSQSPWQPSQTSNCRKPAKRIKPLTRPQMQRSGIIGRDWR